MNIEEFGKQIKGKYPQYSDIPDAEIGQKMLDKYPQYKDLLDKPQETQDAFLKGHSVLKGIGDFLGVSGLAKGLAQGVFLKFTPEGKDIMKRIETGEMKYSDLENIIGKGVTNKEIIGSGAQTALTLATLGQSPLSAGKTIVGQGAGTFLKTAGQQALKSAGTVGLASGISAYGEGKTPEEIAKSSLGGAALGGVVSGVLSGAKAILPALPAIFTRTSDIPEEALKLQFKQPSTISKAAKLIKGKDSTKQLAEIQGKVMDLRKELTSSYDLGVKNIINEFADNRASLASSKKLLENVSDKFAIELPQNINSVSAKEGIDLVKALNEVVNKGSLKKSAEGFVARKTLNEVRDKLIETFGGSDGSLATLLTNYSDGKRTLDAVALLSAAFKKDNVAAQNTALNMLKSVFNDNKVAYMNAIKAFEAKTGIAILPSAAAAQTQGFLPKKSGSFGFDDLFRTILLPITSPSLVGKTTRTAGRIAGAGDKPIQTLIKGSLKRLQSQ